MNITFSFFSALFLGALLTLQPGTLQAGSGGDNGTIPAQAASVSQIGPNDQLSIWVFEVDEFNNKIFRVDETGFLDLPMIGRVEASGRTTEQIKADLLSRFAAYVRDPKVTVSLIEGRSRPVSVVGAVNTPGIHQLEGHKSLLEMISLSGGLRPDAGYSIRITRDLKWGRIALPGSADDPSGRYSIAEVRSKDLVDANDPVNNIQLCPNDVISVPKAEMFYVMGDVRKPGGYVLGEKKTMPLLQALSLAEGTLGTASSGKSRIVRPGAGAADPEEIPVDLRKVLAGKGKGMPLQAGDILYVPSSATKKISARAIEAGIGLGTGVLIWRR